MSGDHHHEFGGENTEVAQYMLCHQPRRGTGRGSVIVGKSVDSKSGNDFGGMFIRDF